MIAFAALVACATPGFSALLGPSAPTPTATPMQTPAPCDGDCNGDGRVVVNELITLVNIALGNAPVSACPTSSDCCGGDICVQIAIDCIMRAVNSVLYGCPHLPPICGGFAGLQCASDEVCDLRDPTCSVADLGGVCVRRPRYCPLVVHPVCACDGQTYPNDCVRLRAGVPLAHVGRCESPCCAAGQVCIPELPPCK